MRLGKFKGDCKCGHRYNQHEWKAYRGVCWYYPKNELCPCEEYEQDNLRYLEECYESKSTT